MNSTSEIERQKEAAIDALRLKAFETNSDADRQAYFDAVSKWFQDRHIRRVDAERVPFLSVQGAVKKLEWTAAPNEAGRDGLWFIAIDLLGKKHEVIKSFNGQKGEGWTYGGEWLPTLEAAKDAAQADYSARILSALEPSTARELAFYEGDDICARLEGLASWLDGSQHSKWCGRKEVPIHGYSGEGKLVRAAIAAIRTLSSPDHADAGKVEGDGEKWPMRELIAKAMAYQSVGDPHAKTVRGNQRWEWFVEDADKFINVFGYYLPALPSAPSEGVK